MATLEIQQTKPTADDMVAIENCINSLLLEIAKEFEAGSACNKEILRYIVQKYEVVGDNSPIRHYVIHNALKYRISVTRTKPPCSAACTAILAILHPNSTHTYYLKATYRFGQPGTAYVKDGKEVPILSFVKGSTKATSLRIDHQHKRDCITAMECMNTRARRQSSPEVEGMLKDMNWMGCLDDDECLKKY